MYTSHEKLKVLPRWTADDETLWALHKAILAVLSKPSLKAHDYSRICEFATQAGDLQRHIDYQRTSKE